MCARESERARMHVCVRACVHVLHTSMFIFYMFNFHVYIHNVIHYV